jgi:hypothetical protein
MAIDINQLREVDQMDHDAAAIADDVSDHMPRTAEPDERSSSPRGHSPGQSEESPARAPAASLDPSEHDEVGPAPAASLHPPEHGEHSLASSPSQAFGEEWEPVALRNREVNDIDHLGRTLPQDLGRCVTTLLTPLRGRFSDADFHDLVRRQTTTLRERDINGKDDLIDVLRTVSRKDTMMRLAQGTVGGLHFNLPGIATSYGPEPKELIVGSTAGTNALQGAVGGLIAGVSDATSTPAKAKTFRDGYYKRPASEQLPRQLHRFNAQTGTQAIGETNASWVGAFGASYVARGAARTIATLTHGPETGAAVDTAVATPVNIAAGIGATFIQHKIDEREGRAGVPFFMARNNLDECIDASRKPLHGYLGSAVMGAGKHVVNTVTQFPRGVKEAFTSPPLVASTLSLGAGLAAPFTAAGAVQQRLSKHPKVADLVGALTKYVTLEGVWAGWSTAYAGAAHLQARRIRQSPAGGAVPAASDNE